VLATPRPARSRYAEKLTHCSFGGRRSNHGPANREMHFPQLLCFTFFNEIEFSVGTERSASGARGKSSAIACLQPSRAEYNRFD
jgi:hypothetical protein